jgi:glycosyltransferase involved in cell wall biosynthesis
MKKNKHVLIIVENNWVPVDRRVWYEACSLRDSGWEVSVICPKVSDTREENSPEFYETMPESFIDGIRVFRFPLNFADRGIVKYIREYISAFYWITKLSLRVWRSKPFSIVHISNPPDIFFPLGIFYRIMGAKFVFDQHDLFPKMVSGRFSGLKGKIFLVIANIFEYLTMWFANGIVFANSTFLNLAIRKRRNFINKSVVVRNGPKIKDFLPVEVNNSLKGGFEHLVCYVGIMGEEDGVREFADVIQKIVLDYQRKDIFFCLVGDGSVKQEIEQYLDSIALSRYVAFPGMITDDYLVRQYMSTADVLVSPEPCTDMNYYSTFIKVGEYMAMQKPIVAFDLPETRKTAGSSAVLIKPGNIRGFAEAVLSLIDNPNVGYSMGKIGRERIENKYGWEHQFLGLIRLYESLINHYKNSLDSGG